MPAGGRPVGVDIATALEDIGNNREPWSGWDEIFHADHRHGEIDARHGEINGQVARRLQPLFKKGGRLMMLGIGLGPGGLHAFIGPR